MRSDPNNRSIYIVKERPQPESNLNALQGEVSLGKGFPLEVNASENGA